MIVQCINGDFSECNSPIVKNILLVGDDDLLPKAGMFYEVLGFGNLNGIEIYELDIPSSEAYGAKLLFTVDRFITVNSDFVPNHYDKEMGVCRMMNFYSSLSIDSPIDITFYHEK